MGTDKSKILFNGEPLLHRVCRIAETICSRVVAVRAENQILPDLPDRVCTVTDLRKDEGPLVGFLTGLERVAADVPSDQRPGYVLLVSCDAPFLQLSAVNHLVGRLRKSNAEEVAALIQHEGFVQPFPGVYSCRVLPYVRQAVETGERSIQRLLKTIRVLTVSSDEIRPKDPDLLLLRNLNTPEDLINALRISGEQT